MACMKDTFVQFDDAQVIVQSEILEVHDSIRDTFRHMLSDQASKPFGALSIRRSDDRYVFEGTDAERVSGATVESLLFFVEDGVRTLFISRRPDLLWLHAGAAEDHGKALVLMGSSGRGKSTLTTMLVERGWRLLSDELVPIAADSETALPFPQKPSRRLADDRDWNALEVTTAARELIDVPDHLVARAPVPIECLVYPEYSRDAKAELMRLPAGSAALEMLRSSTNFFDKKHEAVARAVAAATSLPAYRLIFGRPADAIGLLVALL